MAEPKVPSGRMTSEEFLVWYDQQPESMRYELLDGIVYPNEMQGERIAHAEAKMRVAEQLRAQIRARNLPCQGFGDGMAVKIDGGITFEPDAMVRCGPKLPGDATFVSDPVIVVEVVSPSSQRIDALTKLTEYFRNPSIVHYLIVIPDKKQAIHHRRGDGGAIATRVYGAGMISFEPPGLELDLAAVFAE